jgi:LemA protein
MPVLVLLAIIILFIVYGISLYNDLVKLRNNRENTFADIDVLLKQRLDLIPQLVETVKGYMKHEDSVLTKVTDARSSAVNANTIEGKIAAEMQLTNALQGFRASVEAYPNLKANQSFAHLQNEISGIENKLADSRRDFNSTTRKLNIAIESFPSSVIANMNGFKKEVMFETAAEERAKMEAVPKINF